MQSTGVEIAPIRVAKETLIALGELIVTREDMVVTHTRQDGSTLAEFADGTSISSSHADEVAVEKAGCPRFEFRDRGKRLMVRLRSGTVIETEISDGGSACAGAARKFSVQNQDLRTFNFETSIDGASKLVVNTCASGSNECVFDWVGGSFSATDSSNGTRFAVDSSGGCTVTPSQVTPQLVNSEEAVAPLDPVNSEGGFVRQFLQSPLRATPDVPCNPPALFMLEDDGSGVQLLRDLDLFEFFKGCSQNPDVEIIERIINENDTPAGLAVTVVGKPYSSAQASSDIVVFRQLIRYPPVGLTERTAIKERLAKPATPAATEELNRTSSSNLEDLRPKVVLGRDKLETVAEIVRMYSLHRKQHCGIDAIGDSQVHKEEKAHRMQELMDRKEQLRHKQTLPSAAQ
ncbi:hypothetical protein HDU84_006426 [Entophlyctis sp. JEL0112]|nr:hypothetical protein HDU84_006426 [Entophlyctis sp. JEL0112]